MSHGSVIFDLAEELGKVLTSRKVRCGVAESCTGGELSSIITSIPNCSNWFDRGFVTYSNESKTDMLGVPPTIIRKNGAVSEQTAKAMAEGVIAHSDVDVSVAITGIAGPGGGTKSKPVGTVWIAWAGDLQQTFSHCYHFEGNRPAIRYQAIQVALEGLIKRCDLASHPIARKKSKERYFFALVPSKEVADLMYKQAKLQFDEPGVKLVPKPNLHLTLSYLGNVPPDFLQEAMRIASPLKTKAFDLSINQTEVWTRKKIGVLETNKPPSEFLQLVENLNHNLISAGYRPPSRPFLPHITVVKKWPEKQVKRAMEPIYWSIDSFCLMKSTSKKGSVHYEVIAEWPLSKGKSKASE